MDCHTSPLGVACCCDDDVCIIGFAIKVVTRAQEMFSRGSCHHAHPRITLCTYAAVFTLKGW